MTWQHVSRILELREMLLSFQSDFSLVNAAIVFTFLGSIISLEPSQVTMSPGPRSLLPSQVSVNLL